MTSAFTSSSSTDLSADPTVVADLRVIHTGLDTYIAAWQKQRDTTVHHTSAAKVGLPDNFNTKEVVYGHCTTSQLYVFVLNITRPEDTTADTEGYEYTPGTTPNRCAPTGWRIMSTEKAAADWYFVTIDTRAATATPAPAAMPTSAQ